MCHSVYVSVYAAVTLRACLVLHAASLCRHSNALLTFLVMWVMAGNFKSCMDWTLEGIQIEHKLSID